MAGPRPIVNDEQLAVLRLLADRRRRSPGQDPTRMVSQLHHVLLELIPGGTEKDLSAVAPQPTLVATSLSTSPKVASAGPMRDSEIEP